MTTCSHRILCSFTLLILAVTHASAQHEGIFERKPVSYRMNDFTLQIIDQQTEVKKSLHIQNVGALVAQDPISRDAICEDWLQQKQLDLTQQKRLLWLRRVYAEFRDIGNYDVHCELYSVDAMSFQESTSAYLLSLLEGRQLTTAYFTESFTLPLARDVIQTAIGLRLALVLFAQPINYTTLAEDEYHITNSLDDQFIPRPWSSGIMPFPAMGWRYDMTALISPKDARLAKDPLLLNIGYWKYRVAQPAVSLNTIRRFGRLQPRAFESGEGVTIASPDPLGKLKVVGIKLPLSYTAFATNMTVYLEETPEENPYLDGYPIDFVSGEYRMKGYIDIYDRPMPIRYTKALEPFHPGDDEVQEAHAVMVLDMAPVDIKDGSKVYAKLHEGFGSHRYYGQRPIDVETGE